MKPSIKVRIQANWEPADSAWLDMEFSDKEMKGDQVEVFEAFKLAWAGIRERYLHG